MLKSFALAIAVASAAPAFDGVILADHTGEPLVSARIRVRAPSGEIVADRDSDRSGRFSTPALKPGSYRIEASKPGYLPTQMEVTLPSQAVRIRLAKLGVISGRVADAEQKPVPGAFVFPLVRSGTSWRALQAVQTDDAGEYRLHSLAPRSYRLALSRASFQLQSQGVAGAAFYPGHGEPETFVIAGGEEYENVDFRVPGGPLAKVSGKMEGADGEVQYVVALARRDQPLLGVATTRTDDDGAFSLSGVPSGSYFLYAAGPVRGSSWRDALLGEPPLFSRLELDVAGQDISDLTLAPAQGLTAVMSVESAESCPREVSIRLLPLEAWAATTEQDFQMPVDERRTVEQLAPGRFQVVAEDLPPGCFQDGETILDPRAEAEPVVLLSSAARLAGRLLDAASPDEYRITLAAAAPQDADESLLVMSPDADGGFVFEGLRPGFYRIVARPDAAQSGRWMPPAKESFLVEAIGGSVTEIEIPAPPLKRTP